MIGTMPVFVALFSAVFDGERFPFVRKLGLASVVLGVVLIALQGFWRAQEGVWRGIHFSFAPPSFGPDTRWHFDAPVLAHGMRPG
jgi:drug/metabolite transporter (DMT)-like permease